MTKDVPSSGKLRFMKLDCEELAPNFFFSFLFKKRFLLILSRLSNQVDVVERTLIPAPLWGDIPVKENVPIPPGCSLTNQCMDEKAVHIQ